MHKIDAPGATALNEFTDGNPDTATPATDVWSKWLNTIQREIIEVIAQAGITLNASDDTQLYDAIMVHILANVPSVPDATELVKGKVELATTTEASTGTDTVRAVTPAGVKGAIDARVASDTVAGLVELATGAETITGVDAARAVTPAALAALTATLTRSGLIELATSAEAITGSDAVRAITPSTLAAVLALFDPEPVAIVKAYAGTSATIPSKYLMPFGQEISRATYPTLFAAIGTAYGVGDGSSTFNLPDIRGRTIAGLDDMGGTPANRITNAAVGIVGTTLGAAGGSQTHVLQVTEIPSHNHTGLTINSSEDDNPDPPLGSSVIGNNLVGAPTSFPSAVTGAAGGGQAHNNVQPTIMMNYIIKVL